MLTRYLKTCDVHDLSIYHLSNEDNHNHKRSTSNKMNEIFYFCMNQDDDDFIKTIGNNDTRHEMKQLTLNKTKIR
ncbi:hypothetical protein DERF_011872 [Dermatophagoides farinae]|uniref:Uncharacterized protein n=1 Tax=Dermatophagoides farinae TaxID=6954 RepID=A0A922HRH2_DERFA|nr:hypothetical protein DERF_011872 [Dermatophagoides farinae]